MRWSQYCITASISAIAVAGLGCAGDTAIGPDPNAVATAIAVASGDRQTAEVGAPLAQPIAVRVIDQDGAPMPGVVVTFAVTGGGGSLATPTAITNSQGLASTTWTMGYVVNLEPPSVLASVSGPRPFYARFTATARLTAGMVVALAGDHQSAAVRSQLPTWLSVQVRTPGPASVPVRGVVVLWTVTAGGGTTTNATSTTGVDGVASSSWTLGDTPGTNNQVLSASVAAVHGAAAEFVASAVLPPATIAIVAGDSQSGTPAHLLAQRLVVVVRNELGEPVPGVALNWQVNDMCDGWCGTSGMGAVIPSGSLTDANGEASASFVLPGWASGGAWRSVVTAWSAGGGGFVAFTAMTHPGPAAWMELSGVAPQSAPAGSRLPEPIAVAVFDWFYNPVPGVTVQWSAAPGSGSTEVPSSVTDSNGVASTHWTIGATIGTDNQTATATVAGISGSPVTFLASALAGP